MSGFEVRESMAGGRKSSGRGRRCGRPEQEVEAKAMYRMRLRMVRVLEGRGRKRLGAVREEGTASKGKRERSAQCTRPETKAMS